jgi:hypothetical protein
MKHILLAIFLNLFLTTVFSQETPVLNISVGMPISFKHNQSTSSGTPTLSIERINLLVEKPIKIRKNANWTINPGISYFLFNEIDKSSRSALGGWYSNMYKHNGICISTKLLYNLNFSSEKIDNWYFGAVAGAYIYTKTTGKGSWRMIQQPHNISGKTEINKSGQEFFHSVHYGAIAGFKSKSKENSLLSPSFEFSFFPGFVTLDNKRINVGMFSVVLGINKKRATQIINRQT